MSNKAVSAASPSASAVPQRLTLRAHPSHPAPGVAGLHATARRGPGGLLRLRYELGSDAAALRLPPWDGVRRGEELWRHTCFEAFVAAPDAPGYLEFNFSPGGAWAAYSFDTYRQGMRDAAVAAPSLVLRRDGAALELAAQFRLDAPLADLGELRLALSAVLEHADGTLSYWALRHAPGKPDFHHGDGFALRLAAAPA